MAEEQSHWSVADPTTTRESLAEETHELPELRGKRQNSIVGVIIFSLLLAAYLLVVVGNIVSIAFFVLKQDKLSNTPNQNSSGGQCVLFAGYNSTSLTLTNTATCQLVLWGLVGVAIIAFLMCISSCIRCGVNFIWKITPASPLVVADVIMLCFALIGALIVSVTITLGRTATCQSMAQTYPAPQPLNCSSFNNTVSFSDGHIYIAEMSSWAVSLLLLLLTSIHVLFCCCCMFLCVRGRRKAKFDVELDDTVPSPFNQPQLSWRNEGADDSDDPLVDPTSDANPPSAPSEYEAWNDRNQFSTGWNTT